MNTETMQKPTAQEFGPIWNKYCGIEYRNIILSEPIDLFGDPVLISRACSCTFRNDTLCTSQ
jgi:hypothetical protein